MNDFKHIDIKSGLENIAEQLQAARIAMKIDLAEAARQTGVRSDYLRALEEANIDRLPAGLYGRNYLREYALFLRLDPRPLLKSYDQESSGPIEPGQAIFVKRAKNHYFLVVIPKIAKALAIAIAALLCLAYLLFYFRDIASPPYLELIQPDKDINTSANSVEIIGRTEPETKVFINNEVVLIDNEGNFSLNVNLKKGLNTITVSSQKRYSQSAELSRKILVE